MTFTVAKWPNENNLHVTISMSLSFATYVQEVALQLLKIDLDVLIFIMKKLWNVYIWYYPICEDMFIYVLNFSRLCKKLNSGTWKLGDGERGNSTFHIISESFEFFNNKHVLLL